MDQNRFVSVIIALALTSLACQAVTGIFLDEEPAPVPPTATNTAPTLPEPVTQTPPANTCPATLERILSAATEFYANSSESSADEQNEQYLVTYAVQGNQISDPYYESVTDDLSVYQDDTTTHQAIWEHFTSVIPARARSVVLAEFSIMTDGTGNSLAAVAQTYSDPALWALEVDIADSDDTLNLTFTLIHEFAHLLTLGPEQVPPSLAVFNNPDDEDIYYNEAAACPDYFPGEGCARPDSYINAFFNAFWTDIHAEWQDINLLEEDDEYYEALDDFYFRYEDRFLTDYAATNPEEDIAEAFTFFVLTPRPIGDTIAEQKILFFYQYPELVQLRNEILSGVCQLNQ